MTIPDLYRLFKNASGISTDSRNIEQGNLFFALKGDNFDGNRFAMQTLESGASYAVVDDPQLEGKDERLILVANVLKSLQDLANFHRHQLDIPLIAITGSNGKTTTKELLAAILATHYQTHFTKGNFNNHIGVPLTLLKMTEDTEIAVIEMGANHIGEIAALCTIAAPTHGVITNIGKAHLEGFGGLEGVKKAKSELYRYLGKNNGVGFINLDEAFLKDLSGTIEHQVFYHQNEKPDPKVTFLEMKLVASRPTIRVAFLSEEGEFLVEAGSNLVGTYNFNNIQTAVAIGRYFKVPAQKIKKALEAYTPTNNRSQILKKETNTFILDAYNANPTSMRNALDNLDQMDAETKIAIIGDMLELGAYSEAEHQSIFEYASAKSFDYLIIVGAEFSKINEENRPLHFPAVGQVKDWFQQQHFENALILLKGSRGIGLEKLLIP